MATTNIQKFAGDVDIAGTLTSTTGVDKVSLATDATNTSRPVIFSTGTTGAQPLKTDAGLTYNPNTNKLTVSGGLSTSVTPGSYLTGDAYDGSTARTFAVDATTDATASKIVARDSSSDIQCRLVRPDFADEATINGAMAFRVNNSSDNYVRFCSDTGAIRTFLDVPTRTGGNASGTWGIGITGNAGTATTLQTTRYINDVGFNGSGNITVEPYVSDDNGTNANRYLTFVDNSTAGYKRLNEDTNLYYNPSTNTLDLGRVSTYDMLLDTAIYHKGETNTYMSYGGNYIDFQVWPGGGGDDRTYLKIIGSGGVSLTRNTSPNYGILATSFSSAQPTIYWQRNSPSWRIIHYSNNYFDHDYNGVTKGYIVPNRTNIMNFTGQHRCFVYNVKPTEIKDNKGLIVSANKNVYYDMNYREDKGETNEISTGNRAISINESLPLVSLSNVAYDKSCFGVISDGEDPNGYVREQDYGNFVSVFEKQAGDTRAYINSLGEGSIWVIDVGGNLESGDYITTSNVLGYGMKQNDDIIHNYTVAKITMDCDFNPQVQPVRKAVKEMKDVNYWTKLTKNPVSYERYIELDEDSRTTEIETYYSKLTTSIQENLPKELTEEKYNKAIEKIKSQYEVKTRTIYIETLLLKRRKEEEGYKQEVISELENKLDENGCIIWQDDPEGATENAYEIRYLTSDGTQTDEANAVYKAAFVGCTYHCG
jgi:hypothetical protein